ncbi:MAG: hypothetical protein OMM_10926 [Candidatus Magnetoglobus multicellularis str. Araruama]|uniref:Uncharacterized protein n=1 Tax=Candidatus Magnetoglobus multicellularis str. Araruama TaxID=890399 RepID=A0A1V1NZK4_9BACT|nr:MAG: hypothetical protein OMM_10926 [Candidatus Magnetoglobus multicellularis str. Araruama]
MSSNHIGYPTYRWVTIDKGVRYEKGRIISFVAFRSLIFSCFGSESHFDFIRRLSSFHISTSENDGFVNHVIAESFKKRGMM